MFYLVTGPAPAASKWHMATLIPDLILIQQVVEGNTAAFALLIARHQQFAFHIAYKLLRHRQRAEEATQDAFVKAYRQLVAFRGEAQFSTWLYRIVYTTAVSHARRRQLPTTSLDDDNAPVDCVVDDARNQLQTLAYHDQKQYLEAALATLAPNETLLISLFYQHEHSVAEIGEITGLSKANIKVKLLRTRRKLYAVLHQLLKQEIADLL